MGRKGAAWTTFPTLFTTKGHLTPPFRYIVRTRIETCEIVCPRTLVLFVDMSEQVWFCDPQSIPMVYQDAGEPNEFGMRPVQQL